MSFIHIICDYGPGDLAFSEVVSALVGHLPQDSRFHITSVSSFDTIATGFVLAQLSLQEKSLRPDDLIVFANTAPRQDLSSPRKNNEGEGLLYGVLSNGVPIVVVNSGYSLSFVREDLKELWSVELQKGVSQFRSRDFFPPIVGMLCTGKTDFKRKSLSPKKVIPPRPSSVVGFVDSFGNIKTTIRAGDKEVNKLKPGQRITIEINGVHRAVTVATGSFNVQEGDIAFAPGSSGHKKRFWEIFQRGGDAWRTYKKPGVGASIRIHTIRSRG